MGVQSQICMLVCYSFFPVLFAFFSVFVNFQCFSTYGSSNFEVRMRLLWGGGSYFRKQITPVTNFPKDPRILELETSYMVRSVGFF